MKAGSLLLLLAIGLACADRSQALGYLKTTEGEEWKCDDPVIDAAVIGDGGFSDTDARDTCKEFCKRIETTVTTLENEDLKPETTPKKMCKITASALAQIISDFADPAKMKTHMTNIHTGSCLAALMNDWAARDAACSPVDSQEASFRKRVLLIMVQYYSAADPVSTHRRSPSDLEARRAEEGKHPAWDSFCSVQLAKFLSVDGGTLFDNTECEGKNPLWSEMKTCPAACWTDIKKKLYGGGCIAMYYDTVFQIIGDSYTTEGDNKLKIGDIDIGNGNPEDACKDSLPCVSVDKAISACAKLNSDGADLSLFSAVVEKTDSFGGVKKGGVRCWQGMDCH